MLPPLPAAIGPTIQFTTGIENSSPLLPDGRRVDQLTRCGHHERWPEDFARLEALGIGTVRYGPALFRAHPGPDRYDWSSCDAQMEALRVSRITVIADLCHFGVPDWLSGFDDPAFPSQFASYAGAFARQYPWVRHYTVINEPYITALFSAYWGWWNEAATGMLAFARSLVNICRAHELAVAAILAEQPEAVILQTESAERYTPADSSTGAAAQTALWNELRYAALDLTLGRMPSAAVRGVLASGGLTDDDLNRFRSFGGGRERRWLGIDYYDTCEQRVHADGHRSIAPVRVGLAAVAQPYHARYGLPLYLSETNESDARAVDWLHEIWSEALLLRTANVPVIGFTWYGLTDSVDWKYLLREDRGHEDPIGLTDLGRNLRPVGTAYAELIAKWTPALAMAPAGRVQVGLS
ncbi:MAG TPA: family 1 glycosylhydrolase [Gemmatimonadales bacterium]|nr:family 1 glycosylhydrolase [Gemmatimonadales bacterium]